ncbi:hypothetical protein GQ53DRAFT_883702 [Thozetella sp. PMI_491]|nr:hypothetical protein GQ53DRAFT_883702 [Thozetella sp. PMI_491]
MAATTMDVSALVAQMHETLSTIHNTLASLDTKHHDTRLDELELQRDSAVQALLGAFSAETESLGKKRETERAEIAERRRQEDEERERKRRQEDDELAERDRKEDEERTGRLDGDTRAVEEDADGQMSKVEEEAEKVITEGRQKLAELEAKRQVSRPMG